MPKRHATTILHDSASSFRSTSIEVITSWAQAWRPTCSKSRVSCFKPSMNEIITFSISYVHKRLIRITLISSFVSYLFIRLIRFTKILIESLFFSFSKTVLVYESRTSRRDRKCRRSRSISGNFRRFQTSRFARLLIFCWKTNNSGLFVFFFSIDKVLLNFKNPIDIISLYWKLMLHFFLIS